MSREVVKFNEYDFRRIGAASELSAKDLHTCLVQLEMLIKSIWQKEEAFSEYHSISKFYAVTIDSDLRNGELSADCGYDGLCYDIDGKFLGYCFDEITIKKECAVQYMLEKNKSIDVLLLEKIFSGSFFVKNESAEPNNHDLRSLTQKLSYDVDNDDSMIELTRELVRALLKSEIHDKSNIKHKVWKARLPVLEDAILWMEKTLCDSSCKCTHEMLAEAVCRYGTDREGRLFGEIDADNPMFGLRGAIRELAGKLVPSQRKFGEGAYVPEKCVCKISDHRKMTEEVRKARKDS